VLYRQLDSPLRGGQDLKKIKSGSHSSQVLALPGEIQGCAEFVSHLLGFRDTVQVNTKEKTEAIWFIS